MRGGWEDLTERLSVAGSENCHVGTFVLPHFSILSAAAVPVAPNVWSSDQQHQRHLGPC